MTQDAPAGRAARMDPADRRAAIIDAVLPIVAERGVDVTSRELATAACVAEGTIFRAFGDKSSLLGAVAVEGLHRASGPEETRAELAGIDPDRPLASRLAEVIELGRRRMGEVVRWMGVLRVLHHRAGSRDVVADERVRDFRAQLAEQRAEQRAATLEGLTAVLAPDAHCLRVPVEVAVALVEASIAGTHARVDHLMPAPSAEVIADALVHGIVTSPESSEA
ncbi:MULTISPECIES: TetR/AcrR family transcriptional regulator [Isoptericola]|uniref:TetR/AcrR family transcriptional regulator n=1 Tax=Isoptericola TaxID=254250 RepID=UPI001FAFB785|nr:MULTISPECIES: TetR/AcrR family transcriptional regulator [Isoptericola]MCK0115894.1 TetR/AcrR family transcriptional regulator [Isoptericola sp. S6320L]